MRLFRCIMLFAFFLRLFLTMLLLDRSEMVLLFHVFLKTYWFPCSELVFNFKYLRNCLKYVIMLPLMTISMIISFLVGGIFQVIIHLAPLCWLLTKETLKLLYFLGILFMRGCNRNLKSFQENWKPDINR